MWWDVPSRLVLELSACSVLGWKSPIHVGAFIVETEHHPNSRTLSPPLHWQWLKDCLLWSDALVLRVTSWHVRCTRWRKPTRMPTFQVLFGQALAYTRHYGKPLGGHILTCSVLQIDWTFSILYTSQMWGVGLSLQRRFAKLLRTGCGKTLAFVLPVVERMTAKNFIKQSRKKAGPWHPMTMTQNKTNLSAQHLCQTFTGDKTSFRERKNYCNCWRKGS